MKNSKRWRCVTKVQVSSSRRWHTWIECKPEQASHDRFESDVEAVHSDYAGGADLSVSASNSHLGASVRRRVLCDRHGRDARCAGHSTDDDE